ncbi:putative Zinc metallopeptidase [Taphrina deformans PYCC 5710]|uniref:Zinc metallopeptidase n=1 Tax=Taphrina deformans (strain PYCC 5710 / ATCC 11124 / CBS 356.35 / IMI 108563 / JCM 9778 / NBRC 8474) TaxID=1097556 RepID=R4XC90_TAPDE|nr:putative Zinc metallopeptidase [Taphrina deformans PYCC 5710]|eukprot:CCG83185.1 putative Zinc metallopeptidase [Taphrina deformans PYCC 5710]
MTDRFVDTFIHLKKKPKAKEALDLLKRVAAHAKPIMESHHWHIKTLAEFFPTQTKLLGTNYGKGIKISLRLRHHYNDSEFLSFDDIMGTMLHELSHNVHGPHDAKFYALLDDLNLKYDTFLREGFRGDDGDSLGGRARTIEEARKVAAGKALARARGTGSTGRQLGGDKVLDATLREKVATAAQRRLHDAKWCGHGRAEDPILVDEEEESVNRGDETRDEKVSEAIEVNEELIANDEAMVRHTKLPPEVIEIPSDEEAPKKTTQPAVHGSKQSYIPATKVPGTKRVLERTSQESEDFLRMKDRGLIADTLYDHLKKLKKDDKQLVGRNVPLGKWQCGLCTLLNPLSAEQCAACEAERPANSHQVGDYWACERCLQFNPRDRWMCLQCQGIKKTS